MSEITKRPSQKYRVFAFTLYPDSEQHMQLFRMINRFPKIYKAVYILHDKDVWTKEDEAENENHVAGTLKKPHYHFMVSLTSARYPEAFAEFLGLDHVEGINARDSYLQYMIHATPNSCHKHPYSVDCMQGESSIIALLSTQNSNFV